MSNLIRKRATLASRLGMFIALGAMIISLASCTKQEKSAESKEDKPAEQAAQKTFASPADAGAAVLAAAKSGDQDALLAIFGKDAKELLSSGDAVKDKEILQDFVAAYTQMNRWAKLKAGGQMLFTGADNHPFPIPLDQNASGQWYFDTAAGKDEILARRVGAGELTAIAACGATVEAQAQYFSQTHDGDSVKQYAQKFGSDEGKQNGLYWAAPEGQPQSPLGPLGDFAKAVGYVKSGDQPQPFNGYLFRILTKQGDKAQGGAKDYLANGKMTGGFAVIAYPAEYRNSGIMTFIVSKDGVVYQKDLGESTADAARAMTEYNPDDGWKPAIE